jgi:predicted enzyme related to lactoylglutathione lyase
MRSAVLVLESIRGHVDWPTIRLGMGGFVVAHAVVHFEIMGTDGPKLREFYGKLFDWKFQVMGGAEIDYGTIQPEAGGIGGGVGAAPGRPGYVAIYVTVDDINAALKQVVELGGKTVVPRTVIPNVVTWALFSDPEGHLVGLAEGSGS